MTADALYNRRANALYNIPQNSFNLVQFYQKMHIPSNAGCSDLSASYRYCYFYTI